MTTDLTFFTNEPGAALLDRFKRTLSDVKYFELKPMYVTQIPIPPASDHDKATIETLVQDCLTAQGQAVASYETEIDNIVARLYSLTDAELQIIRGEP